MFRVTRKQIIRQNGNTIEFEDSCDFESEAKAEYNSLRMIAVELQQGYQWYGPDKVIFESPSFYRSVTVTIEKLSDA